MPRVACEIGETWMENDEGRDVLATVATCTECGHETCSFGTTDRSVKRCLVLMREECPAGCDNFYVADDDL